jgi:uncharacterized protein (DUF433 family)
MPIVSDDEVLGGDPRIEGTRIGVLRVAELVLAGYPVEDVADQYEISPADAYDAMAYYHRHSSEMNDVRRRHRQLDEEIRERGPVTARSMI